MENQELDPFDIYLRIVQAEEALAPEVPEDETEDYEYALLEALIGDQDA